MDWWDLLWVSLAFFVGANLGAILMGTLVANSRSGKDAV